jgi:peroxiredoxin Q/BCP
MVDVGDIAPSFSLPDGAGGTLDSASLAGKTWVLYFYPRDDTPGCTKEACSFRDHWADLQARGIVVLGVSGDSVASHAKFAKKYSLPFPLLADTDHAVSVAWGTWGEKVLYGKKSIGMKRTTFLVGPDGRVRKVWKKPKTDVHAEEILAAV